MQEYGSIIAQIVTSAAQIPVAGATLTISHELPDGGQELLAVRMSDYDGFTEPFELPTPPASDSQTRQTAEVPYALVDLRTERTGYGRVLVRGAQVFSGVLGGGMSNVVELYDRLPDIVARYVFSDSWEGRIVPARWGDSSGVRGAARLWDA